MSLIHSPTTNWHRTSPRMYAKVQKLLVWSILAIYFVFDHANGNHIQGSSNLAAKSHSRVRRARFEDRIIGSIQNKSITQDADLDAFDYSKCGRFTLRQWQLDQSAFNCQRGRSLWEEDQRAGNCSDRVGSGDDANYGEFPSAVRLRVFKSDEFYACSGTLIHKNLVITVSTSQSVEWSIGQTLKEIPLISVSNQLQSWQAASCLDGSDDIRVHFGSNNLKEQREALVEAYCLHKNFHYDGDKTERRDLGMIKLVNELEYIKGQIEPACLSLDTHHHSSAVCALAGFGQISGGTWSDRLKTISLKARTCKEFRRGNRDGTCYSRPDPSHTGGSCLGDAGAGMYCYDRCGGLGQRAFVVGANSGSTTHTCHPGKEDYQWAADFNGMSGAVREMIQSLLYDREEDKPKHKCFRLPYRK